MDQLFLWMSKESDEIILEMKSTSGEEAMNIVEMTTEDLEYDINLVDKAVASFGKIDANFESCTVGKMLSKSISCYREIVCERVNQCSKLHCFHILRNFHSHPNCQQPLP